MSGVTNAFQARLGRKALEGDQGKQQAILEGRKAQECYVRLVPVLPVLLCSSQSLSSAILGFCGHNLMNTIQDRYMWQWRLLGRCWYQGKGRRNGSGQNRV
jgi:hypothetical protein